MSQFIHVGEIDGIEVSYTLSEPKPERVPVPAPEPEVPPHVQANVELYHTLSAEFFNRGREYQLDNPKGTSNLAHKYFNDTLSKDKEQVRSEYFAELKEALDGIKAREPKPAPKKQDYETAIESFGGSFSGESQVMPHARGRNRRTVLVGEN